MKKYVIAAVLLTALLLAMLNIIVSLTVGSRVDMQMEVKQHYVNMEMEVKSLKESIDSLAGKYGQHDEGKGAMTIDEWAKGIDFEIGHHSSWLRGDLDITKSGWFKYEKETKLKGEPIDIHQKNICNLFNKLYGTEASEKVKYMIDHGAGPFTNLGMRFNCDYDGSSIRGLDAQVAAYDPLAPQYNELLTEFNIYNTLRTMYCPSENLSKCTGKAVAYFAIIINALDHSRDPLFAFEQSLQSVKVGGVSCVYTTLNEANNMNGAGFHQWNFDLDENDNWIIENFESKTKTNVDESIKNYAVRVRIQGDKKGKQQAFICYQKKTDAP